MQPVLGLFGGLLFVRTRRRHLRRIADRMSGVRLVGVSAQRHFLHGHASQGWWTRGYEIAITEHRQRRQHAWQTGTSPARVNRPYCRYRRFVDRAFV
jgi:hypothetical protein